MEGPRPTGSVTSLGSPGCTSWLGEGQAETDLRREDFSFGKIWDGNRGGKRITEDLVCRARILGWPSLFEILSDYLL